MPTILIAWELGAGLGHLGPIRALAAECLGRGGRIVLPANNPALFHRALASLPIEIHEAQAAQARTGRECGYSPIKDAVAT